MRSRTTPLHRRLFAIVVLVQVLCGAVLPNGALHAQNGKPYTSHEVGGGASRAGSWYASYGWNEDRYTRSKLHFSGRDHDFVLYDVEGHQRQNRFTARDFLNPFTLTIPQFNLRIGYYVRDDLDLSIGMDHMKYVVRQGQTVRIDGYIKNTDSRHDGVYSNAEKQITRGWLAFEHTDGLNWFHVTLRKHQSLLVWRWVDLRAFESLGVGALTPRTDAEILLRERHDRYRLAGYAVGASGGLNLTLWRFFFLECEGKAGFFHIVDARTSQDPADRARHHAFFGQAVVVFGGRWRLPSSPAQPSPVR